MEPRDLPGIDPEECRTVRPSVYPEGLRTWTTDRCANVVLGRFVLRASHAPMFDGDEIPDHLRVGYEYPVTVALARVQFYHTPKPVVIPPELDPNALDKIYESCRFHIGTDVVQDGRQRVWICGKRNQGAPVQASIMSANFVWRSTIRPAGVRQGYEYAMGAYETPTVIEVHSGGAVFYCGIPI